MDHLLNRQPNERCGIKGVNYPDVRGELFRKLCDARFDKIDGLDGVGARGKLQDKTGCRFSVQFRMEVIIFVADLDRRNVPDFDCRPDRVGSQYNGFDSKTEWATGGEGGGK